MYKYINNISNGQYYYIDGKYVLFSSNKENTYNFTSVEQDYTMSNNFNFSPEPVIKNAHQASYQAQYKYYNYSSIDNY